MTDIDYPVTTVDLLRHGECVERGRLLGSTDTTLSDQGLGQMRAALRDHDGWGQVVSSPMARCRAFAQMFSEHKKLPLDIEPGLREIDFGDWDGMLLSDIERADGENFERFHRDPQGVVPPGGESTADATARVLAAWQRILTDYQAGHLLLVAHGGTLRLLLCHILSMPLSASSRLHTNHACLVRLRVFHTPEGPFTRLVFLQTGPACVTQ